MSFLKLRGSYAEVGNATDPFGLDPQVEIENGTARLNEVLPNPDLLPEETTSLELGMDLRFLENRLRLDATWYRTNTTDQIFRVAAPPGTLGRDRVVNGGDIQNTGIELVMGATIIDNSDFSWDLDVNFATNQSEVIALAGTDSFTLSQFTDFIREYRLEVGGEFGDVYTRGYVRDDNGNVLVGDDGLPVTTSGLEVKTANFTPDWLGGIRNSFKYKDFTLSALIDIRQGGDVISFTEAVLAGNGLTNYTANGRDGLVFDGVDANGNPNTISTTSEALWTKLGGRNTAVGEAFVRDASNIRLRELVIGYTVPQRFLDKTFLTSASVSFVGRNLFFLKNNAEILDPEAVASTGNSSEGRESFAPPTTRTFGLSFNFGF
ncbi:MAG: TonB-dependent receptor [Bacteroidota bacterium]